MPKQGISSTRKPYKYGSNPRGKAKWIWSDEHWIISDFGIGAPYRYTHLSVRREAESPTWRETESPIKRIDESPKPKDQLKKLVLSICLSVIDPYCKNNNNLIYNL